MRLALGEREPADPDDIPTVLQVAMRELVLLPNQVTATAGCETLITDAKVGSIPHTWHHPDLTR